MRNGEMEEVERDFVGGGVQERGHSKMEGSMLYGIPYIFYQPEFSVLLSDCFHMSCQSGAVFCNSQEIRGFPYQDTVNRMPELEFKVYHNM